MHIGDCNGRANYVHDVHESHEGAGPPGVGQNFRPNQHPCYELYKPSKTLGLLVWHSPVPRGAAIHACVTKKSTKQTTTALHPRKNSKAGAPPCILVA
eukprot:1138154-Pelagomonas_calceolata.AAC.5